MKTKRSFSSIVFCALIALCASLLAGCRGSGGGGETSSKPLKMDIADAQSMFAGSIYKITKNKDVQEIENPFPLKWKKVRNNLLTSDVGAFFENKLNNIYDTPQGLLFVFGFKPSLPFACFLVDKKTGIIETIDNSSGKMIDNPFPELKSLPPRFPDTLSWECPVPSDYLNTPLVEVGKKGSYYMRRKGVMANPDPAEELDAVVQTIQKLVKQGDGTFAISQYIVPSEYTAPNGKKYPETIWNFALDAHDNIAYTIEQIFNPLPDGRYEHSYRVFTAKGETLPLEGKFWVGLDGHIYALKATRTSVLNTNNQWIGYYDYSKGQIQKYDQDGKPTGALKNIPSDEVTNGIGNHNANLKILNKIIFAEEIGYGCNNDPKEYKRIHNNQVVLGNAETNFQVVDLELDQTQFLKASKNYVYISGVKQEQKDCEMSTHIAKLDPNKNLSAVGEPYDLRAAGYREINSFDVSQNDIITFSATNLQGEQVLGEIDANGTIKPLGKNPAGKAVKIVSVQ